MGHLGTAQILQQKPFKQDKTTIEQSLEHSGAAGSRKFEEVQSTIGHFFPWTGHLGQTYRKAELWNVLEIGTVEGTKHFQIVMSVLLIVYNLIFLYFHPNTSRCHAIH